MISNYVFYYSNSMVWFGSTIFSTNKESMISSKCLIKSLLSNSVWGKMLIKNAYKMSFEVAQCHAVNRANPNLLHSSRRLMHSFYTLPRQMLQTPKLLWKFKTTLVIFCRHLFVQSSNNNMCIRIHGSTVINNCGKFLNETHYFQVIFTRL